MSEVTLKFTDAEEYQRFLESVKNDIIKDLNQHKPTNTVRTKIRKELEELHDKGFGKEAFPYNPEFIQSFYGIYKIAFKKRRIDHLDDENCEGLNELHNELLDLIVKYQSLYSEGETNERLHQK